MNKCIKCGNISQWEYRLKQTAKQKKIDQSHIGMYCKRCGEWNCWITKSAMDIIQRENPDVKILNNKSIALF